VLLSACGDSATTTTEPTEYEIGITGGSTADRKMATDLREYIRRGCRGTGSPDALARALDAHPANKKQVLKRHGTVEELFESAAFQQIHRVCTSYREVQVNDGVITVTISLPDDEEGQRDAQMVCNTVRGSDVADFTTHWVVDEQSTPLATCHRRGGTAAKSG
jgi:hypothetical protein